MDCINPLSIPGRYIWDCTFAWAAELLSVIVALLGSGSAVTPSRNV